MIKDWIEVLRKNFTRIFPWILLVVAIIVTSSIVINSSREDSKNAREIETKIDEKVVAEENVETSVDSTKETSLSENKTEDQKYVGKIRVLINGLNLRDAPSGNSSVIKQLKRDDILFIISEENGWYKVTDEKETEGYVTSGSQYVELIQE